MIIMFKCLSTFHVPYLGTVSVFVKKIHNQNIKETASQLASS